MSALTMTEPEKRKNGRPSSYTDEIAAEICTRMAHGETLAEICRSEGMPDRATVYRWTEANEGFRSAYARARIELFDHWAEEIVSIADDGSNDWMERRKRNGELETKLDYEHVQRSNTRIDARKWLLAKLQPEKYGDRVALTGHDGGPLAIQVVRYDLPTPELKDVTPVPMVLEHAAAHAPQAPNDGQAVDKTEDDKS
jgi:hypothetical protein